MEEFMKWAPYIVALLIAGAYLIFIAYTKPKKIKEWLIDACGQAEEYFGSGTGQLKLRKVYAMFVEQYPIFSNFISFEKFSQWVEESLAILKRWIDLNPKAAQFFGEIPEDDNDEE